MTIMPPRAFQDSLKVLFAKLGLRRMEIEEPMQKEFEHVIGNA